MANNAQTIKSFLVGLGFDIDQAGMNRFAGTIARQTEAVHLFVAGIKEAALKVTGFVRNIIDSNDDIYFLSVKLKASAANIKSVLYAAGQTGGEGFGDLILSQVQNLKVLLERLPNLESKIQSFGVVTRDQNGQLRDSIDIYRDLAHVLNQMEGPQKYAQANVFQIDPATLDLLKGDKFDKFFEEQKARSRGTADAAADDANRIETAHRRLSAAIDNLKDKSLVGLMDAWDSLSDKQKEQIQQWTDIDHWVTVLGPKIKDFAKSSVQALRDAFHSLPPDIQQTIRDLTTIDGIITKLKALNESRKEAGLTLRSPVEAIHEARNATSSSVDIDKQNKELFEQYGLQPPPDGGDAGNSPGWWGRFWGWVGSLPTGVNVPSPNPSEMAQKESFLTGLEQKFGLTPGTLDRIWAIESSRGGENTPASRKGALGPFQFMPDTAKQYGLKNPKDFQESATAAAKFLSDSLKQFGDLDKAVAAYDWGPGNVAGRGLGAMPDETREYLRKFHDTQPIVINQNVNTNVTGAGSAADVGKAVTDGVNKANGMAARSLQGRTS